MDRTYDKYACFEESARIENLVSLMSFVEKWNEPLYSKFIKLYYGRSNRICLEKVLILESLMILIFIYI